MVSLGSPSRSHKRPPSGYYSWNAMKRRCYDKSFISYPRYGGRGINVCERWLEYGTGFKNFLEDVGPRPSSKHSIDRIDNNGDYEPDNVRWSGYKRQNRNRKDTKYIEFDGFRMSLADWAEQTGIKYQTILMRLQRGWAVEDALTKKP